MVKKLLIWSAAILIIAGLIFGGWLIFRPGPEKIIRQKIFDLTVLAARRGNSGAAATILRNQSLQKLFADQCVLSFHKGIFSGVYSNSRIASEVARANMLLSESTLHADIISIEFPSPDLAVVEFTGSIRATAKSSEKIDDAQDFIAKLKKFDSGWKFTAIQINNIMQK